MAPQNKNNLNTFLEQTDSHFDVIMESSKDLIFRL